MDNMSITEQLQRMVKPERAAEIKKLEQQEKVGEYLRKLMESQTQPQKPKPGMLDRDFVISDQR